MGLDQAGVFKLAADAMVAKIQIEKAIRALGINSSVAALALTMLLGERSGLHPKTKAPRTRTTKKVYGVYKRRALSAIRRAPSLTIAELADEVYGDQIPNRVTRIRNVLATLKREGKIKQVGWGKWTSV